jgi:MFS family permease
LSDVKTGTIETKIPARLDRVPWSRFHWMVVIGLGTVWVLDGLEVTMVGSVASRLTEGGSGVDLSAGDIGTAAAFYVAGACLGALFFGQLTDRFGRKKLFVLTLALYIAATTATALTFSAWYFFLVRFLTGAGIGGEYAAINSAIDELIPARVRGRVDLMINGSYWLGSAAGAGAALLLLDTSIFAQDLGWRLAFGIGAVLGLTILLVRRHVPESPRWLFIHGRAEEAERIVDGIEAGIEEETHEDLSEPDTTLKVRQREAIAFREIARVAFKAYPRRAILGLSLFVGQAFLYNGVTFNLGTLFHDFYDVSSGTVPIFIVLFAIGNLLGPLTLGRLFDTVGRKPMIAGTYLGSAAVAMVMSVLFVSGALTTWSFEAFILVTFFLASAGASAAYLTVSEIFPMETRALVIAFFYAVGTAIGGITGPLLFGHLIGSGERGQVAIAFGIGAVVMAVGGIVELFFGVDAEQSALEDIAKPLTAEEAEEGAPGDQDEGRNDEQDLHPHRRDGLRCRRAAQEIRAQAAEHRAAVHELRPRAEDGDARAGARLAAERILAEIAELRAQALDEQAAAREARAEAAEADDDAAREAATQRALAADERSRMHREHAEALGAEHETQSERHASLAEAALERARAHEQRALAEEADGRAQDAEPREAERERAREAVHAARVELHEKLAQSHELRSEGEDEAVAEHDRLAREHHAHALAAEQRLHAVELRLDADAYAEQAGEADEQTDRAEEAARRERGRREFERRLSERVERRRQHEREGLRHWRPGPGAAMSSPGMVGTAYHSREDSGEALEREIEAIDRALMEHGELRRQDLARLVGARFWGPGRFAAALRQACEEGRARRISRATYASGEQQRGFAGSESSSGGARDR